MPRYKPEAIVVGKPYPIRNLDPTQEFCVMEIRRSTPEILIQFPGLTQPELKAFKKSFKKYWFGVHQYKSVQVPYFIFDFPKPFNPIELTFDARVVQSHSEKAKQALREYFEPSDGQTKNLFEFYLLEGGVVKAIKHVGLHPEAVREFQAVLKHQLEYQHTPKEFREALRDMRSKFTTYQFMHKYGCFKFDTAKGENNG